GDRPRRAPRQRRGKIARPVPQLLDDGQHAAPGRLPHVRRAVDHPRDGADPDARRGGHISDGHPPRRRHLTSRVPEPAAGTASILWTIFTPRHTAVKTQARGTGILPMSRGIVPPTRSTPRAWGRDLPAAAGFKPVSVAGTARDLNRLTTPLYPRRKAGTRADLFVVMLSRPADDTAAAAPAARRSGGSRDRAAAQNGVTVVEDRRLAPCDAAGGRPQPDPEQVAVEAHGSRMDLAVRAQLNQAVAFPAG